MFCEKRKSVVSAGSELFNTHYHGIDDTPTQEAYHWLNVLYTLTDSTAIEDKIEEEFNGKGGWHFESCRFNSTN